MKEVRKMTEEGYSDWYQSVISAAGLAKHSPVKGCMIIEPYGYAIWENIQHELDSKIKKIGVSNMYFPLLIPESFLSKEADHVEGFSPELAVVTIGGGQELKEKLVLRPTSETIIYDYFKDIVESYKDLPVTINQWANVIRWEKRPRLFLRTTEFLWQEGHTLHLTHDEAEKYALDIAINIYQKFAEDFLAIPVIPGRKSEREKFAGADKTYTIEALMQDGKSLQMGTSHNLADHFSKAFGVKYLDKNQKLEFPHSTSWGVSTRLIGGLIMSHGDDKGIMMPPKIAPTQVVIVPITKEGNNEPTKAAEALAQSLDESVRSIVDKDTEERLGERLFKWEKKGIPLRVEIGPKELESDQCIIAKRNTGEKITVNMKDAPSKINDLLAEIQSEMLEAARKRVKEVSFTADTWEEFKEHISSGFVYAHWCEDGKCEEEIKEETQASVRCLPLDAETEKGEHKCIHCGKTSPSNKRWVFAKSY